MPHVGHRSGLSLSDVNVDLSMKVTVSNHLMNF